MTKQIHDLPLAGAISDADLIPLSQSQSATRVARGDLLASRLATTAVFGFELPIANPAAGTVLVVDCNTIIGTLTTVRFRMVAGSCTATLKIADLDGTNATNVTGAASVAVSTTVSEMTATAANVMQVSGSTDRQLHLTLASVVGAGPFRLGVSFTRGI